jgi:hypothetical protein
MFADQKSKLESREEWCSSRLFALWADSPKAPEIIQPQVRLFPITQLALR